jgi:hypothetical protein
VETRHRRNSSNMRLSSARLPPAYRPLNTTTNSSRVAMLTRLMPTTAPAKSQGANQMRQQHASPWRSISGAAMRIPCLTLIVAGHLRLQHPERPTFLQITGIRLGASAVSVKKLSIRDIAVMGDFLQPQAQGSCYRQAVRGPAAGRGTVWNWTPHRLRGVAPRSQRSTRSMLAVISSSQSIIR